MNGTPHVHGVHVVVMLAVACGALAVACGVPPAEDGEPDPDAYLTPVAQARANGVQPYWLAQSFEAGGDTFSYIEGQYPEGISGVRAAGLKLDYFTADGELGAVTIQTFPTDEWLSAEAAVRARRGEADRSDVHVAGVTAELITYSSPTRPINAYKLIIETPDSGIVVSASSGGSVSPGAPDVNPLIDYETFLSVMENLRPYPE
jgi:hypothetical protein